MKSINVLTLCARVFFDKRNYMTFSYVNIVAYGILFGIGEPPKMPAMHKQCTEWRKVYAGNTTCLWNSHNRDVTRNAITRAL